MAYELTGISANDKLPSVAVEIKYAQGDGASASLDRDILLIADMTADGYATADTEVVELSNENDAVYYFGEGSEVHLMARQVFKLNKNVKVFAIGTTESTGNTASGTVTIAGTAVKSGSVDVWVAGTKVSQGFAVGDTAATIGDSLNDKINAVSYLPVSSSDNGAGVVTLTANQAGTPGNSIRLRTAVTSGAGLTSTAGAATLAGGTTESDVSDALDAIASTEYYYQVLARNDATNVQAHVTQLELLAEPSTQIRQVGLFGVTGTVATAVALTQNSNVNSERMQCVQLNVSESLPCELAAMVAALRAKYEISDWGYNFNGLAIPAKAPASSSNNPTNSNLRTALEGGVSPCKVDKYGGVSLVASRTTRSLSGANPDYRASQTYIVSVTDAFAKNVQSDFATSFAGKKVSANTNVPIPNVAQPKHMKTKIIKWLKTFTEKPWLDPSLIDEMIESVDVVKSTATLSGQVVLRCAENLDHVHLLGLEASDPQ